MHLREGNIERVGNTISDVYPACKPSTPKRHKLQEKNTGKRQPKFQDENQDPASQSREKRSCIENAKPLSKEGNVRSCSNNLATDFSQMFQNIRQAEKGKQQPGGAITSFEDIAARKLPQSQRGNQIGTQLTELFRQDVGHSNSAEDARPEVQAKAARRAETIQGSRCMPIDWTLKTKMRISSSQAFQCCQAALTAHCTNVSATVDEFCRQDENTAHTLQERWQDSLLTWQYPEQHWHSAMLESLHSHAEKGKGVIKDFLHARHKSWQAAFQSLYYMLRTKHCKAFYLITAEGSRHPLVALFTGAGVAGGDKPCALISRSTRGLRSLLQDQNCSLAFQMPHASFKKPEAASERQKQELQDLGQASDLGINGGIDNTSQSLLKFIGSKQVHGIYNWLLDNVSSLQSEVADVPMLLAPVPFIGASLHHINSQIMPLAATADSESESRHRLELKGLIPPWAIAKVCHVIESSQQGDLQVLLETERLSSNLNVCNQGKDSASFRSSSNTRFDFECGAASVMNGAYLREVKCKNGTYDARLLPS